MRRRKEYEDIRWDNERGGIVITRQERIDIENTKDIDDVKSKLKNELRQIINQVKSLKVRAEEIKSLLDKLEGKAGPTGPAP